MSHPLFRNQYLTENELRNEGFASLGSDVRISSSCHIVGADKIRIGDNCRIDGFCTLIATNKGYIDIGSYVHIGGYCVLLGAEGITFENFSGVSWGVQIYSRSDDFSGLFLTNPTVPKHLTNASGGPVILKKHVIVGANTVIMPRAVLGEGAAVGAQSLVTKSLDGWTIYSGVPAKKLKSRKRRALELERNLIDGAPAGD